MIVSSQVLDNFIVKLFGHSYAIDWLHFGLAVTKPDGDFASTTVISLGFVLCCIICN
jgi:hypothetical protein